MKNMDVETQVRRLLGEIVGPYDWETVPAGENLRGLGLNSLNCISLIVAIEELFDIVVPYQRLGIRYAGTIEEICGLIRDVQQGRQIWE